MGAKIENKNRLYGNIQVYSPDMRPMFKANLKKVNWYLNSGDEKLAEVVEWDEELNIPKSIKLTFEPNGLGHYNRGTTDEYFLSDKENICVVTGVDDWTELTKHHIVPFMYRKWFPDEYKSRNCHDIVLITREKHYEYEELANVLKDKIAEELGIPTLAEYSRRIARKTSYLGVANAILSDKVPMENKIDLCIKFTNKTGLVPTRENINAYIKGCKNEYKMAEFYGKFVYEKIKDPQAFVERWRQHFIDTMKPQFMPKGWRVDREICIYNMTFLDNVLFLMKENGWVDDIDFINTSHQYLCIKDCFNIFTKGEKVLIKNNIDSFLIVYIVKNKNNIDIIRVTFEENVTISDYFKRTRKIKIEEFLKNGKMERNIW